MPFLSTDLKDAVYALGGYPVVQNRLTLIEGVLPLPGAQSQVLLLHLNQEYTQTSIDKIQLLVDTSKRLREGVREALLCNMAATKISTTEINMNLPDQLWEEDYRVVCELYLMIGAHIYSHPYLQSKPSHIRILDA